MIISHTHRYLYIAVPKTASQAIRNALEQNLGDGDWQQHAMYGQARLPFPALASLGHGHVSAAQAEQHLPADVLEYFRFAFVRHPFDRFVSASFFLFRDTDFKSDPVRNMKIALGRDRFLSRVLIQPQTSFLYVGDRLAVDRVGYFERLNEDFAEIAGHIGLPETALPTLNKSDHEDYRQYLDRDLVSALTQVYARDFELLDYEPTL